MLLYQKKEKAFPSTVEIDGNVYIINADYRNILRIFALSKDKNVNEYVRVEKLSRWFFTEQEQIEYLFENVSYEFIIRAFVGFINPKDKNGEEIIARSSSTYDEENETEEAENQFDYDFDADEIYASFASEYGIDLIEIDFLHWYKFKILLMNLSSESAFKKKIELRFMDLSHFSGQSLVDMQRAKSAVQLPVEYTDEELREMAEFEGLWGRL